MLNVISIIQCIDQVFTNLIFIPMIFVLYVKFRPKKPWTRRRRNTYLLCLVLISLFLLRIFCEKFIFTPVNYPRFTDSGLFPLIRAFLSRHLKNGDSCHLVRIWDQYPLASYGNSSPAYLQYKYTVRTGYSRTRYVSCMYKRGENR